MKHISIKTSGELIFFWTRIVSIGCETTTDVIPLTQPAIKSLTKRFSLRTIVSFESNTRNGDHDGLEISKIQSIEYFFK